MTTEDGLRFRPTEAELLKMLRQFTDRKYTGGLVEQRDLYCEKEPWEICTGSGTAAADHNTWYFFTELKRKQPAKNTAGNGGKRFIRSVGKGTWHGTSKVENIFDDERKRILLGFKRNFTYWGDEEERKGEFVMNEFSLPENTVKSDRKDFVICRLKRKKRGPIDDNNAVEDSSRMMLSLQEEGGNNNNDDDVMFSYDELFGGIEVEDMTASPALLLPKDPASNYYNETYPCTTNETAVVAAPPSGVSGDTVWTLEMMEDFLLKDDDEDVGGGEAAAGSAAVIREEDKAYGEWISSTMDNFGEEDRGCGGGHSFEFDDGGIVASPMHMMNNDDHIYF